MEWLTHAITGIFGAAAGSLLPFLLKWKQQSSNDWQRLFDQGVAERTALNVRVAALEQRVESLHAEHVQCLQIQSELRAKIAMLERSSERGHR